MKLLTDLHQITDISWPPNFSRTTIQLTLFDLYIKILLASKRNLISSEAFSTRFSAINLLYLRLLMKLLTDLHQIADISGPPTSRGTQCNILKHLQHAFQLLIYNTLRYRWNSSRIYIKSQTFQDHQTSRGTQFNWHFSIYISKHFSHLNVIKYILKHLQHAFQLLIYNTYVTDETPNGSTSNHRHFRTTKLLAEHNSI